MKKEMRICIVSPPDREKLVAEIIFDNEQWAELDQEDGTLNLEIYPRQSKEYWKLSFDELIAALNEAKKRLANK
jgi:hypothetical protein